MLGELVGKGACRARRWRALRHVKGRHCECEEESGLFISTEIPCTSTSFVPFNGQPDIERQHRQKAIKLAKLTGARHPAHVRSRHHTAHDPRGKLLPANILGMLVEAGSALLLEGKGRVAASRHVGGHIPSRIPIRQTRLRSRRRGGRTVEGRSHRHRHACPPRRAAVASSAAMPSRPSARRRFRCSWFGCTQPEHAARSELLAEERGERLIVRSGFLPLRRAQFGSRSGYLVVPARLKHLTATRLARIDEGQERLAVRARESS